MSSIGEPSEDFMILSSWDEALASLSSNSWGNITQNAQGDLTEWLSSNATSRYQGVWNKRVKELRPIVNSLVEKRLLPNIPCAVSSAIVETLRWDLLLAAMDADYEDLKRRPSLPSQIRDCYEAGHIPCGYEQSKLVAY